MLEINQQIKTTAVSLMMLIPNNGNELFSTAKKLLSNFADVQDDYMMTASIYGVLKHPEYKGIYHAFNVISDHYKQDKHSNIPRLIKQFFALLHKSESYRFTPN